MKNTIRVLSLLEEIMPTFLENRRKDVGALQLAIQQSDFALVRTIGHKMKGSSASYGFEDLSQIGLIIENAGISKDSASATLGLQKLSSFLENLEVVYI